MYVYTCVLVYIHRLLRLFRAYRMANLQRVITVEFCHKILSNPWNGRRPRMT